MRLDDNMTTIILFGMGFAMIMMIIIGLFLFDSGMEWIIPFLIGIIVGIVVTKIKDRSKKNKSL